MPTGDLGKINHPGRASQQIDFRGVRIGQATPSDIDGIIEIGGELFIFLEYKHESAPPISYGQRLCLERLVDAITLAGRVSLCVLAQHATPIGFDIDGAGSRAISVYYKSKWIDTEERCMTVADCVSRACDIAGIQPRHS